MMDPQRWRRIDELFHAAADLDAAAQREFLRAHCGDDALLVAEVEALLAVDADPHGLSTEVQVDLPPIAALQPDDRVGAWRVVEPIARGGMGEVYLGERADGAYQQRAAIKVIRGSHTEQSLLRFLYERRILARLQHHAIARLLDGGTTAHGDPYLVLEYVDGERIDHHCDRLGLDLQARVRLLRKVCVAVGFAHRNAIVHRDLKPQNILVTGDGEPKLLDFGISKMMNDNPEITKSGVRPMTPEYASPEQIQGRTITTATDVYALGVMLYRLLTGCHPHPVDSADRYLLERAICDNNPVPPSQRTRLPADDADRHGTLAATADRRTPAGARRQLRGDLDAIILRALQRDPERRYPSADALADDLSRYLEHRPVEAHADSLTYRVSRFVRRHRLATLLLLLLASSITGGAALSLRWALRANRAALHAAAATQLAEDEARKAAAESTRYRAVSAFLSNLLASPGHDIEHDAPLSAYLDRASRLLDQRSPGDPLTDAQLHAALGLSYLNLDRADDAGRHLHAAAALLAGKDAFELEASVHHTLSNLCLRDSRFADAERELRLALDLLARGEPQHPERIALLADLGMMLATRGDPAAGEQQLRKAVLLCQDAPEAAALQCASAKSSLATLLHALGRDLEQAELLAGEALDIARRQLGPVNTETLAYELTWLRVQLDRGAFDEVRRGAEEGVARARQLLGNASPDLACAFLDVLAKAWSVGPDADLQRAEHCLREALDLQRAAFGDHSRWVADRLGGLAFFMLDAQRLPEARQYFQESLDLLRENFGDEDHGEVITTTLNLAVLETTLGDFDAALQHLAGVDAASCRVFGETDQRTLEIALWLGVAHEANEQEVAAEADFRRAIDPFQHHDGPLLLVTAKALVRLAELLIRNDRRDEGLKLLRDAQRRARAAGFAASDPPLAHLEEALHRLQPGDNE